jgi:hypothetical protein
MAEVVDTEKNAKGNRLIREKSPYLLQHAYNPVDWYPWGGEAFEKAKKEDKPIFLSIGYSTCHWCHVMEKESFEDPEVAELMNEAFVSIKVDREERPDLDHLYMTVSQMMTGSGGWPLNLVMTPAKKPFFAATYIPKGSRFGRTGMMELVPRIRDIWRTRRKDVLESADSITNALRGVEKETSGKELGLPVLQTAYTDLAKRFDQTYGGFSGAPKFPTPHNFLFMLRYWKRTGDQAALKMVEKTLQEMRKGGIYDQIGFGFHRYSTDREWLVPHFEKMLYDQAMLATAYLEAYQATGEKAYADTAKEIFTYVLRDMKSPEGAFYSAEDADSEGVEGKFYVWTEEEFRQLFDEEQADLMARVFHLEKKGNFREEATAKSTGKNILYLGKALPEISADLGIPLAELEDRIGAGREKAFEVREKRIHPHKDDKLLTDWNGLMIAALAKGGQVLGEKSLENEAKGAADFIMSRMRDANGRLFHRYREGEAGIIANLDDYAFMMWGLIELYEASFDVKYLSWALELNAGLLEHFSDPLEGGFFFTPDDGEELLVRKKEVYDGAIPSGNAVTMHNLLRLARMTGRAEFEEQAARISKAFSSQINQFPSGYTQFLCSVDFGLGPSYEVIVSDPSQDGGAEDLLRAFRTRYIPNLVVIYRPSDEKLNEIVKIAPFLEENPPLDERPTAYVCRNKICYRPTTDAGEMLKRLEA